MTVFDLGSTVLHNTLCLESFMFHLHIEHKLSQERDAYQTDTVAPIWQLRENLKFWLTEMQHYVTEDSSLRNKFSLAEKLQQVGILTLLVQLLIMGYLAFSFILCVMFLD